MTCMATKSLPRRHLRDEQSVGWTPSEDAAMVQASVEVTMVDDLDLDVENAETETASSTSVAGVSVGKSEKTSDCHITNQSKIILALRYVQSVAANPKRHLCATPLLICAILTIISIIVVTELKPETEINPSKNVAVAIDETTSLCLQYCELYAKAAGSCPYTVSDYVPEASHQESREECISECEIAQFSKTHPDTT